MTNGTTNLDILDLAVPSIEADEISSGSAAAGAVLTADGNGGARWQTASGGGGGVLEYVAWISQQTNGGPVSVTELVNTLGTVSLEQAPEQTYYTITCANAFAGGHAKVMLAAFEFPSIQDGPMYADIMIANDSTLVLSAWDGNPPLSNRVNSIKAHIHIKVFP